MANRLTKKTVALPLPPQPMRQISEIWREGEREEEAHATAGASEGEGEGTLWLTNIR